MYDANGTVKAVEVPPIVVSFGRGASLLIQGDQCHFYYGPEQTYARNCEYYRARLPISNFERVVTAVNVGELVAHVVTTVNVYEVSARGPHIDFRKIGPTPPPLVIAEYPEYGAPPFRAPGKAPKSRKETFEPA